MASSILKSSDKILDCYPCQVIDDVKIDAVFLCEDCTHPLCKECQKNHQKNMLSWDHKVIKLPDTQCKESEFQVSGRRPKGKVIKLPDTQCNDSEFMVSGRRPKGKVIKLPDTQCKESEFMVSGRRPKGKSESKETGVDQSQDLPERVQDMALSPVVSAKPGGTSKTVIVYKTATLRSGLNMSIDSDDGPCYIRGILMLQDRIIVCDKANSKLKVFDSDHTFLYEHVCDNKPKDIDKLNHTKIVLALEGCSIRLLSVHKDSMVELLNIKTQIPCYGICCYDGNIYCVLSSKADISKILSQVCVYTQDGKFKRSFEYLSFGKVKCNNLGYITVNPKTGTLYVTDWNQGVVILSTSGRINVKDVIPTPLLRHPTGITIDDFGQIYVCGLNSHNVIQMSADGHDAVEIVSEDIRRKFPECIKIYGNEMFLVVRDFDEVSIFELS